MVPYRFEKDTRRRVIANCSENTRLCASSRCREARPSRLLVRSMYSCPQLTGFAAGTRSGSIGRSRARDKMHVRSIRGIWMHPVLMDGTAGDLAVCDRVWGCDSSYGIPLEHRRRIRDPRRWQVAGGHGRHPGRMMSRPRSLRLKSSPGVRAWHRPMHVLVNEA